MLNNRWTLGFLFFALDRFLNIILSRVTILLKINLNFIFLGIFTLILSALLFGYFYVFFTKKFSDKSLRRSIIFIYMGLNIILTTFGLFWLAKQGVLAGLLSLITFKYVVIYLFITLLIATTIYFLIFYCIIFGEKLYITKDKNITKNELERL